jgi:hypothetical protein
VQAFRAILTLQHALDREVSKRFVVLGDGPELSWLVRRPDFDDATGDESVGRIDDEV